MKAVNLACRRGAFFTFVVSSMALGSSLFLAVGSWRNVRLAILCMDSEEPIGCFRGASTRLFDRGSSSGSLSGHQKHSDSSGLGGSGSRVDPVRAVADELGLSYAALHRSAGPPPLISNGPQDSWESMPAFLENASNDIECSGASCMVR